MIIKGLISDYEAGDKSVRMKKPLSVYVTFADVTILAFTVFLGMVGGPTNGKIFKIFVRNLVEVDKIIFLNDRQRMRKVSMVVLGAVLFCTSTLLALDFSTWIRFAMDSIDAEYRVTNYIPFYLAYVIVVVLQCQFWFVIKALRRRLHVLTKLLSRDRIQKGLIFNVTNNKITNVSLGINPGECTGPNCLGEIIDNFGKKTTSKNVIPNYNRHLFDLRQSDNIETLMKVYFKLSTAVDCVNKFCGVFLFVCLLSCLIHLVVTPYFLVIEIYGRHDPMYISLLCFWIFGHCCRIIGIVEPCYRFKEEEKRMLLAISKLLYFESGGGKFKEQVKNFFYLVKTTDNQFTALGLAKIDRSLITTIVGAVTTYLVIVIQFQKSAVSTNN
ncbi:gustatory receptor for sugar taste 43a-like isoform X2 [Agrilus planipennis]|nr:gustatory receptor for sugar taste 43a-like isoform X2 [Agrilus planipennis]